MGYDAYAVGVVGVRLTPGVIKSKMHTEEQVRGCRHPLQSDVKFCPECGKPAFKTVKLAVKELGEDADGGLTLCGYRIVNRGEGYYDDPEFLAGWCTETLGPGRIARVPTGGIEKLKAEMQERLAPLGLFDEKGFGIHVFLYESC